MALLAIVNTNEETVELLSGLLEDEGFSTVVAYVVDFKRGKQDLGQFFAQHRPAAVFYDVALPYQENWTFCLERVIPASGLDSRHFVFTTTNKAVLERLVGPTGAIEIIGKPYDLELIVRAARRAVAGEQPNPIDRGVEQDT